MKFTKFKKNSWKSYLSLVKVKIMKFRSYFEKFDFEDNISFGDDDSVLELLHSHVFWVITDTLQYLDDLLEQFVGLYQGRDTVLCGQMVSHLQNLGQVESSAHSYELEYIGA